MKSVDYKEIFEFYCNKKVLITGNTGFKGAWLTYVLLSAGANVIGFSLKAPTEPNLFSVLELEKNDKLTQYYYDVRDLDSMIRVFKSSQPDIVIHLAAQPIVRDSYRDPVTTYSTNVMGTVNVCEAVRLSGIPIYEGGIKISEWKGVRSFLNVTTDKVYKNNEWEYGYREEDPLDGFDPYSNSKSCSELVTHSYCNSFYVDSCVSVSTARAGNVIGGGDFSSDRIIPDCVKALMKSSNSDKGMIGVRNPYSTRPYQHVLEPLFAYLMIAMRQYDDERYAGYYNVGPDDCDCVTTGELVTMFCDECNRHKGLDSELKWEKSSEENAPHEANFLKLDCSRIKKVFGWQPMWNIRKAVGQTVNWTKVWLDSKELSSDERVKLVSLEMDKQIRDYFNS